MSKISDFSVFINNFTELQVLIARVSVKPKEPPKLLMRFRGCRKASFEIIFSEPFKEFELQLFALNDTRNQWVTVGTSSSNTLFCNNLAPATIYNARGRVKMMNGSWSEYSDSNVDDSTKLQFRTLEGKFKMTGTTNVSHSFFYRESRVTSFEECNSTANCL